MPTDKSDLSTQDLNLKITSLMHRAALMDRRINAWKLYVMATAELSGSYLTENPQIGNYMHAGYTAALRQRDEAIGERLSIMNELGSCKNEMSKRDKHSAWFGENEL